MTARAATRLAIAAAILAFGIFPASSRAATYWKVSTFAASNLDTETPGNHAAWCGKMFADTCGSGPSGAGGYGNDWYEVLHYTAQIADPSVGTDITLGAVMNHDVEPGADFVRIVYYVAGEATPRLAAEYTGSALGVTVSLTIHYDPGEYLGNGGDLIRIALVVDTDENWSDEDCLWPTLGAVQFDNAQVSITNGAFEAQTFDDFEAAGFGSWTPAGSTTGALSDPTLDPVACVLGDSVTWTVKWTHADDPVVTQAVVAVFDPSGQGDFWPMETEDASSLDGATYSFSRALEAAGEYSYYFRFADSEGGDVTLRDDGGQFFAGPTVSEPLNTLPQITAVQVDPSHGVPGTTFELRCLYSDAEGECPTLALLYLVNPVTGLESSHFLTGDDGDCTSGTWYSTSIALNDPGMYHHRYLIANNNSQIVNSPPVMTDYHEDLLVVTDPTAVGTPPTLTRLGDARPNPFNPSTTIVWRLRRAGHAKLEILDFKGRSIVTLVDGFVDAGPGSVIWNGKDAASASVASGVYFYRLKTEDFEETKRMLLLK